jgi:DNA invertase Pin-like site-specific DNA recombinase
MQVVKKCFSDQISGSKSDRPGLKEALKYVRPGDSLVVWRLDRLGLSAFRKVLIQQQMVDN